eukprot:TRINITY_DN17106_c0_g1_i1.p1 TRINITY_DN17106_c0_g1~~TRINITY_DN17106_c0_g1_i1.p1  ORF type:complete len:402 (-),score=116.55 TRINITY_DN17106_c0_g1_i1:46-1251(-)
MVATTLSASHVQAVQGVLNRSQILSMGAARLYKAHPNPEQWTYCNLEGVAVVLTENNVSFLRMIDTNKREVVFQQEIYPNFKYQAARPFFHTFEMDEFVAGISFADQTEAAAFLSKVNACCGGGPAGGAAPPPSTPGGGPPQRPAGGAPAHTPAAARPGANSSGGFGTPGQSGIQASPGAARMNRKKDKKKKGFFGSVFGDKRGSEPRMEISGPTDFKHEAHIGWDPDAGFEIRNIPPEWRKLFQAAGVKKSELRNPETAKFIMETVAEFAMADGGAEAAELMKSSPAAPPPAPGGGPPPPPAPAAPPPPPAPGNMPPPPRAAAGGGSAPPRNALLDQIQAGKNLKTVDPNDVPPEPEAGTGKPGGLVDMLGAAMLNRRVNMGQEGDSDSDDYDSDDDWSE